MSPPETTKSLVTASEQENGQYGLQVEYGAKICARKLQDRRSLPLPYQGIPIFNSKRKLIAIFTCVLK
jgi:hypothetical protein